MAAAAPIGWTEGCTHYKRHCKFLTPCCNNIYSCRFCHDEQEDHPLNRRSVATLICNSCSAVQGLRLRCQKCGIRFGEYACLICRVFDNENKYQFHCNSCGICRVGGKQNYFHCKICNLCLSVRLRNNHTCVEDASRRNCPLCVEDLHTSRTLIHVPKCGHLLHDNCFEDLKKAGHNSCPVCKVRWVDFY